MRNKIIFSFFLLFLCYRFVFPNEKIEHKKVIICGVVKDGEAAFFQTKRDIENISNLFKDYKIVIYENNSKDLTKNLYRSWACKEPKLKFISEDIDKKRLVKFKNLGHDSRIALIARARNQVLKEISDSSYNDFDFVIMMDLDGFYHTNFLEITNIVENPKYQWDAVFANGSYDILALRSKDFPYSPELLGVKPWFNKVPQTRRLLESKLEEEEWYRVDSAFGGLAIYKKNALDKIKYSVFLNQEIACLYENYILQDNMKPYESTVKNNLENLKNGKNVLICEHVVLHALMKSKGYSNLFINKNLLRLTTDHNHQ